MASTIQRNADMATEYLGWQRHTRNRSRETLFIYTDVIQKLLYWIGDKPLGSLGRSAGTGVGALGGGAN